MNKIYQYYLFFFLGTMLPFIILKLFFQDYYTIILIVFTASIILILCILYEYIKVKYKKDFDVQLKEFDYLKMVQKKEKIEKASSYFFRNKLL